MTIPFYRKAQNGNETGLLPFFFNKILLDLYDVIKGTELEEALLSPFIFIFYLKFIIAHSAIFCKSVLFYFCRHSADLPDMQIYYYLGYKINFNSGG